MTDYIKIKVDGSDEITISWEESEDGLLLDEFMKKVQTAIIAAGYSHVLVDKYMETE